MCAVYVGVTSVCGFVGGGGFVSWLFSFLVFLLLLLFWVVVVVVCVCVCARVCARVFCCCCFCFLLCLFVFVFLSAANRAPQSMRSKCLGYYREPIR